MAKEAKKGGAGLDPARFYLYRGVVYGPGGGGRPDVAALAQRLQGDRSPAAEGGAEGAGSASVGEDASDGYLSMDRAALEAEVERRGLTARRTDGREDLAPRVSDLVATLEAADAAAAGDGEEA